MARAITELYSCGLHFQDTEPHGSSAGKDLISRPSHTKEGEDMAMPVWSRQSGALVFGLLPPLGHCPNSQMDPHVRVASPLPVAFAR